MANILGNPTMGFQESGRTEGASPTAGLTPVWIASSDASLMFRGDVVVSSSSPGANNSGNYITSLQTLSSMTGGSGFLARGIFQGVEQFIPSVGRVVWANNFAGSLSGSTGDIKAWIKDDPDALFVVQASSGPITSSMINLNISVSSNSSAGNTTIGYSNMTVASSNVISASSLPFRIVDFYSAYAPPAVPNVGTAAFINGTDNTTAFNMVIVRLNNCDRTSLTARST
jgi:hypothetical protein